MITKEKVLDALRDVKDPELNRSLVELNMIRNIQIEDSRVSLDVILTIQGCPLKVKIQEDVENAIKRLGAKQVDITFGSMTDEERAALSASLRKQQQAQQGTSAVPPILAKGSKTQFIAIASGKGGVGKSTVTVNLGVALAREGKKVGIIDADIYGFSVPDMMGIEQQPVVIDKTILPVERFGVKVISMGFFVQDNAPVVWRGPMLGKMLRNFFSEVHWGELDYMLLDLPPGTGDVALDVHQMIPQSKEIIVTTPHATAAFVAARAGAMALHATKHEILGVVENMSWYENKDGEKDYVFGRGGGEKLAQELKVELLAQIPLGAPMNELDQPDYSPSVYPLDHPAGQLYQGLARKVIQKLPVPQEK
ncbi:Mrp/NBP35 family ATP-binding protein [Paenactinomyces guangxiensis]|uniref:Iron-sulfur cluster carrier protein n=1 Tax=Paenactinomyces guangxiensis TaxID=1490290 RepID=A0A7W1WU58_9BACL|nr:Mrp/NBP35 family ATP-binding protein [Paenactinomyces guangxiensis]MBA4495926.1 Mrp/NBP35 family ATP-binding protein [Paenactinomyces guangxiensis]MBH8592937.1 Mrp/NBP35 family ATP-binding protein [Paenactinomyces guangxiensis]